VLLLSKLLLLLLLLAGAVYWRFEELEEIEERVREEDELIALALSRRFTRVLVVLFTDDGRVVILLLFSFRIDVPCEGRPERLLLFDVMLLLLPSPLKEEAEPL
jgi:hypothetical protein